MLHEKHYLKNRQQIQGKDYSGNHDRKHMFQSKYTTGILPNLKICLEFF